MVIQTGQLLGLTENLCMSVVYLLPERKVVQHKIVWIAGDCGVTHVRKLLFIAAVDKTREFGRYRAVKHEITIRKWDVTLGVEPTLLLA